jgi:tripartite-type tricarboxylate transporter receptor subunit TctC
MKKRILALLAAMAMSLSLVACGAKTEAPAAGTDAPAPEAKPGTETVKIICGYGVGGTADLIARTFAQTANENQSKYNFIVENVLGGDGFAAATQFADLDPSEKQLLIFGYGLCFRHDLGKEFGTEIVEFDRYDMYPLGTVDDRSTIVYANPGVTLADIVAKAQNGGIKMSGGNPLSDYHLMLGSLCEMIGGKVQVVPYDGGANQKKGLTDGEVDVFVGTTQAGVEEVEAGTLVPILALTDRAFEGFKTPDGAITVPSIAGDGKASELPATDFSSCILPSGGTLACRKGAPQEFIDEMIQIIKDVWNDEAYHGWIESVMLNRFELYGDEAQAHYDAACEKSKAAFANMSGK